MIADFYHLHPMWTWAALAGVLLAAEIATGTGWLLWPAACAGVVAVLALTRVLGLPGEVIVFALLSIASSLTARKYLKKSDLQPGQTINDRAHSLVGKTGQVTGVQAGHARVLVDGAEWEAEGEGLEAGASVEVVKVLGGARLAVKAV